MDGFVVDLDAISGAANGIQDTMDEMATSRVRDLTVNDADFGDAELASAYSDFVTRWDIGVVNLERDGDAIVSGLKRSAAAYRATEESAAQGFRGTISRISGPDPGMS